MHPNRREFWEDAITAYFEELIHIGAAPREEVQQLYEFFGYQFIGLLPRRKLFSEKGDLPMATVTPSHKGLIIYKETTSPPDGYLKKATEEFNTCCACLVVDDGKVQAIFQDNIIPTLEELKETFEAFDKVAVYLGKADSPYSDDDLPPHDLVEDHLSCFITGDLPNFVHDESAHSREFFAIHEYIAEEAKGVYEEYKGTDGFKEPIIIKRFVNSALKPKGCMVLVGSDGTFHVMSVGMGWEMGGWWCSDRLGWETNQTEDREQKPLSAAEKLKARLAAKKAGGSDTGSSGGDQKEKVLSSPITPPKTDTAIHVKTGEERMILIPQSYDEKKRNIWLHENFEKEYHEGLSTKDIREMKSHPYSKLKKNSQLRDHVKDLAKLGEAVKPAVKQVVTDLPTLIGKQQKEAMWRDYLPKISDGLLDQSQIKANADVNPQWFTQLQIDNKTPPTIEEMFFVDTKRYEALVNTYGRAAICLIDSMRNYVLERWGKDLLVSLRGILEDKANANKEKEQRKAM